MVKSTVEILQNFLAFSEYMNFMTKTTVPSDKNVPLQELSMVSKELRLRWPNLQVQTRKNFELIPTFLWRLQILP